MTTWNRPKYKPHGADADVAMIMYAAAPLAGLSVSRSRHGIPPNGGDVPVRLEHFARQTHPHRFAELHAPTVWKGALTDQPDLDVHALRGAQHQVRLSLVQPDPHDLEYLRTAWSFVRAVCDAVPSLGVLDVHASRWWTKQALAAVPLAASFDVLREVRVHFQPHHTPGYGHICHTRGMKKFGRPDVVLCGLGSGDGERAELVLAAVARHMALGSVLGESVTTTGFSAEVHPYLPRVNAPELRLNNAGVVLLPQPISR